MSYNIRFTGNGTLVLNMHDSSSLGPSAVGTSVSGSGKLVVNILSPSCSGLKVGQGIVNQTYGSLYIQQAGVLESADSTNLLYNDNLYSPAFPADNVQEAIDKIKLDYYPKSNTGYMLTFTHAPTTWSDNNYLYFGNCPQLGPVASSTELTTSAQLGGILGNAWVFAPASGKIKSIQFIRTTTSSGTGGSTTGTPTISLIRVVKSGTSWIQTILKTEILPTSPAGFRGVDYIDVNQVGFIQYPTSVFYAYNYDDVSSVNYNGPAYLIFRVRFPEMWTDAPTYFHTVNVFISKQ